MTLLSANLLRYIPRNTVYVVLQHSLLIKTESGWQEGCSYQKLDDTSSQIYTRPYSMFTESKWEVVE